MSDPNVAEFSPRAEADDAGAEEGAKVPQQTNVEVVETGNPGLPYAVLVVASQWTSLRGQTLEITFNLTTELKANFPSDPEKAVIWVPEPPDAGTFDVQVVEPDVLFLSQTNNNRGPGNQVFDFRIGVEVEGESQIFYSADPTIVNSPISG